MDEMTSAADNLSRRNSLKNSPRGLHTSLEGGLDDVDLLAIGQGSPISDIIQRVLGNSEILTCNTFHINKCVCLDITVDAQPSFSQQQGNNNMTPLSKKRPLEEKEMEYVFAKPVSVAPTPRKTKRHSPGIGYIIKRLYNTSLYNSVNLYDRTFQTLSVTFGRQCPGWHIENSRDSEKVTFTIATYTAYFCRLASSYLIYRFYCVSFLSSC